MNVALILEKAAALSASSSPVQWWEKNKVADMEVLMRAPYSVSRLEEAVDSMGMAASSARSSYLAEFQSNRQRKRDNCQLREDHGSGTCIRCGYSDSYMGVDAHIRRKACAMAVSSLVAQLRAKRKLAIWDESKWNRDARRWLL